MWEGHLFLSHAPLFFLRERLSGRVKVARQLAKLNMPSAWRYFVLKLTKGKDSYL